MLLSNFLARVQCFQVCALAGKSNVRPECAVDLLLLLVGLVELFLECRIELLLELKQRLLAVVHVLVKLDLRHQGCCAFEQLEHLAEL